MLVAYNSEIVPALEIRDLLVRLGGPIVLRPADLASCPTRAHRARCRRPRHSSLPIALPCRHGSGTAAIAEVLRIQ